MYQIIFQVFPSCGPEKEVCVKKQSLKDKSCLVACSGLYADMDYYDNNLKQTMQTFEQRVAKGEMFKLPASPCHH